MYTDTDRTERLASNVAKLLSELLEESRRLQRKTERLRLRINHDLKPLIEELPAKDRGCILSLIAVRVQEIFDAAGSPKVGVRGDCLGREGGGIRVSEGGAFAGACVTGSLNQGPTGGGAEVGFTY